MTRPRGATRSGRTARAEDSSTLEAASPAWRAQERDGRWPNLARTIVPGRAARGGATTHLQGNPFIVNTRSLRALLPVALLATSACSGLSTLGVKRGGGLERVDELLSRVERVQVESAVAKERAQAAFDNLRVLLAPDFRGDAAAAHAQLVASVEQSSDQADALRDSVKPLRKTGEAVFARWTEDLESFGNVSMRERSQERLEETRRRHDAILAAAVSAQLAYDSFNSDLNDHALFLEHDFNTTSVALVGQELESLKARGRELAKRLDACGEACQAYVEFSAPRAQVGDTEPAPEAEKTPTAPAATTTPAPAKRPTPKKRTPPTTSASQPKLL